LALMAAKPFHPAPLPPDEPARLAALARYRVLDTQAEAAFDRLTTLASRLFHVPIALVSLVDSDRQWFKARLGIGVPETPRDVAFCAHAILADGVCLVPDTRQDKRFAGNPLVVGEPRIRFYAGAPLVTPDGHRLGTLCIIDTVPRYDFSEADRENLSHLAAIAVDELELRLSMQELEAARQRAAAATQAKSILLAKASHELRTPLNGILGFAELLGQTLGAEGGRERRWVQNIQRSGQHLLGLVNDLLDMSRLANGRMSLTALPIPADRLAATAVAACAAGDDGRGVPVALDLPPDCPPVWCDETAAVRILVSLLSNALRFSPADVPVRLGFQARPEGMAVTVADRGIGMDAAQLARAIELFGQAEDAYDRQTEGSGLGLPLAKALAEAHGGSLAVESAPGRGTTVTVLFPRPPAVP